MMAWCSSASSLAEVAGLEVSLADTPIGKIITKQRYGVLWWCSVLPSGLVVELEPVTINSRPLDLPIGRRTGELLDYIERHAWHMGLREADADRIVSNEAGRLGRKLAHGTGRPFREDSLDDTLHEIARQRGG